MKKSLFQLFKQSIFKNCFNYKGRSGRRSIWAFSLGFPLLNLTLVPLLPTFYAWLFNTPLLGDNTVLLITFILIILFFVMEVWFVISSVSIIIRRLHDLGYSGWWGVVMALPAVILYYILNQEEWFSNLPITHLLLFLAFVLSDIAPTLFLHLKKGEKEKNRYGPPPIEDQ